MKNGNRKNGVFPVRRFAEGTLRGVGQVMFQQSIGCSLLFAAGIFWGAWVQGRMAVAWGAVAGLAAATLAGRLLRLEPDEGARGLWGFNGVLTGCAFMTFLRPTPLCWLAMLLCAASTVWVRRGLNRVTAPWKVNSLTLPFVLMTWLFLSAARMLHGLPADGLARPEFPAAEFVPVDGNWLNLTACWLRGISQVFLLDSWLTGLLFLIGLWLGNGWAAFWAAAGSAIALAVALLFGGEGALIASGQFGFSPVLTGIALGSVFHRPAWRSALWAVTGIVVTVFVQAALDAWLMPVGLPALTAPFCITTWLFLLPMLHLDDPSDPDHSEWNGAGRSRSASR